MNCGIVHQKNFVMSSPTVPSTISSIRTPSGYIAELPPLETEVRRWES